MQKKQTILVVASLLVVILSVTLAYFTAQIIGKEKDISVSSADLKIIFTDGTDGSITSENTLPGWTTSKTFSVTNKSNATYEYNIVIEDLLNTFVTDGFLKYKITSDNDGYNMTDYENVPKSSEPTDTTLAYKVSIPVNVTQNYTVEFIYENSSTVDQSADMDKEFSGKLFITEGTTPTFIEKLLLDNPTRLTRSDFSTVLTETNTKTLYKSEEDNKTVYYFAGQAQNNWLKFGKDSSNNDLYWRIIRTNSDESIRLLYHGTSTTSTETYIGNSAYLTGNGYSAMNASYMYGTNDSLEKNRLNTNNSTIKLAIDTWYGTNLNNYTKYLSTTAIYCNDREIGSGEYCATCANNFDYAAYTRLNTNKTPTYNCTNTSDKFTVDSSTGNGKLTYPIGLMTADELQFAGGVYGTNNSAKTWYAINSENEYSTGTNGWWTMTPNGWNQNVNATVSMVQSDGTFYGVTAIVSVGIRPVISIDKCAIIKSGDGSPTNPYEIDYEGSKC